MGTNTLTSAVDGNVIPAAHHNELVQALLETFVPRTAARVPGDLAGALGSSIYRWTRAFLNEIIVGTAATNLKIYEGATGELWLENSNGDVIKIKDGAIEFLTNGVSRFEITDTGIVWTGQPDQNIPRSKVASGAQSSSSISSDTDNNDGFTEVVATTHLFIQNRKYLILGVATSSLAGRANRNHKFRLQVNNATLKTWDSGDLIPVDTALHPVSVSILYNHTAADATLNTQFEHENGTLTNAQVIVMEL